MLALMLMGFIVLLLLSMALTVRVDLAGTRLEKEMLAARENAQFGLLLALGELQKHTGPDQRVTATASILEESYGESPAQPHWVGVWNSASADISAPAEQIDKVSLFRRWLVSVPEDIDETELILPAEFVRSNDWIPMVAEGTLGAGASDTEMVYAGLEELPTGHFAFWIGDESVKARYNLVEPASTYADLAQQSFDLFAPAQWGINLIGRDEDSQEAFAEYFDPKNSQLDDIVFGPEVGLTSNTDTGVVALNTAFGRHYHDLSLNSVGLLTNVRDGGLKQDLSLAFEMDHETFDAHPDFAFGNGGPLSLYTTNNPDGLPVKHLWNLPSNDDVANGHYKGPTWHLLRDYYRLYRELDSTTTAPRLEARHALPVPLENKNGKSISNLYDDGQNHYNKGFNGSDPLIRPRTLKVAPVVARVQLLLSLSAEPVADTSKIIEPAEYKDQSGIYQLRLIVDPIITLYNPYSTNLWFQGITVKIPALVNSLQWELNGQVSNTLSLEEIVGFSALGKNAIPNRNFGIITIGDPEGITLAPGEVKIYSPGNTQPTPYVQNVPIDAVEGWAPDGGFFLDKLDPEPVPGSGDGVYYGHKYGADEDSAETGMIFCKASDQIAVNFEKVLPSERVIWVSRFDKAVAKNQMIIDAYLVANGEYNKRDQIYQDAAAVQHYTSLRANITFGDSDLMGNIGRRPELGEYIVFQQLADEKQSLGQIDLRLKTEDDTLRPYPMFGLSSMNAFQTNKQSASSGDYGVINPPFAAVRSPVSDLYFAVHFDGDTNRAYWGPTREFTSDSRSFIAGTDIPKAPLLSLGQLQHADIAIYGYESSHAIGNSFAPPWIAPDAIEEPDRASIDMAWLTNNALWDGYYFSSITPQDAAIFSGAERSIETVLEDFSNTETFSLPNARIKFIGDSREEFHNALIDDDNEIRESAHRQSAAYLGVEGSFNVNSTSEEAWKSVLSSVGSGSLARLNENGELVAGDETAEYRFSRFSTPLGNPDNKWSGYSTLSQAAIERLAEKIVEQVKLRGPFLSMSEFVNRLVSNDPELAKAGALQTAINSAEVNTDSPTILEDEMIGYITNDHAKVPVDTGVAGFLTQADLLSAFGAFLTVRGDTFTIRSYGDATDPLTGEVVAQAWCEAIVQRLPQYVNPIADSAATPPWSEGGVANLNSAENQTFGREYRIIAFRWLSKEEL